MKRRIDMFVILMVVASLTGCTNQQKRPWDTLAQCKQENTDLALQNQQLQTKNQQLTDQLEASLELEKGIQFESLNTLEKIRIGRRTGFYDNDNDGIKETLVVYLEPLDNQQDYIKAIGDCRVDLWDLNPSSDKILTHSFEFSPYYLNQNWGGTIFSSYYRLENQSKGLKDYLLKHQPKELTVKVSFSDYIGRKILTDQKVIIAR